MDADEASQHVPLAKCRVLYLGSCPVTPRNGGLKVSDIQDSITKRYQPSYDGNIKGIDTWVTVLKSGFKVQYIGDGDRVLWFPIHTLTYSTAVKYCDVIYDDDVPSGGQFIPLDHPTLRSHHPPIFVMAIRRYSRAMGAMCHFFICKSNNAAFALVKSSTHAYKYRNGLVDDIPAEILQDELIANPSKISKHESDAPPRMLYNDALRGPVHPLVENGDSFYQPHRIPRASVNGEPPYGPVSSDRHYGHPARRDLSPHRNPSPPRRHASPLRNNSKHERHLSPRRQASDMKRQMSPTRHRERHVSPARHHGHHASPLHHHQRHTSPQRLQYQALNERHVSPVRYASPHRGHGAYHVTRNSSRNESDWSHPRSGHHDKLRRSPSRRQTDNPYKIVPEEVPLYF